MRFPPAAQSHVVSARHAVAVAAPRDGYAPAAWPLPALIAAAPGGRARYHVLVMSRSHASLAPSVARRCCAARPVCAHTAVREFVAFARMRTAATSATLMPRAAQPRRCQRMRYRGMPAPAWRDALPRGSTRTRGRCSIAEKPHRPPRARGSVGESASASRRASRFTLPEARRVVLRTRERECCRLRQRRSTAARRAFRCGDAAAISLLRPRHGAIRCCRCAQAPPLDTFFAADASTVSAPRYSAPPRYGAVRRPCSVQPPPAAAPKSTRATHTFSSSLALRAAFDTAVAVADARAACCHTMRFAPEAPISATRYSAPRPAERGSRQRLFCSSAMPP